MIINLGETFLIHGIVKFGSNPKTFSVIFVCATKGIWILLYPETLFTLRI